jgi:hypothetical protein
MSSIYIDQLFIDRHSLTPIIYNTSTLYYIQIPFYLFFVFALITTTLFEINGKVKQYNYTKRIFLYVFSGFLLLRCMLLIVPFPFDEFTTRLVADEIPRFLMYLTWCILGVWLGSSVLLPSTEVRTKRIVRILFIILVISIGGYITGILIMDKV